LPCPTISIGWGKSREMIVVSPLDATKSVRITKLPARVVFE